MPRAHCTLLQAQGQRMQSPACAVQSSVLSVSAAGGAVMVQQDLRDSCVLQHAYVLCAYHCTLICSFRHAQRHARGDAVCQQHFCTRAYF